MKAGIPLIIVDETLLPGGDTEVVLDAEEQLFLRNQAAGSGGELGPVALASRLPTTRLEMRGQDTTDARLLAAILVGNGALEASHPEDDSARLLVEAPLRGRLTDVTEVEGGWLAAYEPWPLAMDGLDSVRLNGLCDRFLRLLIATTQVGEEGSHARLTTPFRDLTTDATAEDRVWRLAEYLFDAQVLRRTLLTRERAEDIVAIVEDALVAVDAAATDDVRVLKIPLAAYVQDRIGGAVSTLSDARPLLGMAATWIPDAADEMGRVEALTDDLDRALRRLLKRLRVR